jgi:hypothetical protein
MYVVLGLSRVIAYIGNNIEWTQTTINEKHKKDNYKEIAYPHEKSSLGI